MLAGSLFAKPTHAPASLRRPAGRSGRSAVRSRSRKAVRAFFWNRSCNDGLIGAGVLRRTGWISSRTGRFWSCGTSVSRPHQVVDEAAPSLRHYQGQPHHGDITMKKIYQKPTLDKSALLQKIAAAVYVSGEIIITPP